MLGWFYLRLVSKVKFHVKMKRVCVLLNGDIKNDSRVIKVVQTISKFCEVDVYFLSKNKENHERQFNNKVGLIKVNPKNNLKTKLLRHTLFYNEFLYFIKHVISSEKKYDYIYANDLPCLKVSFKLKKYFKAKLIYDAHEIYNETLNQFFPKNTSGLKKLLITMNIRFMRYVGKKAEQKYIREADSILTVGQGLKDFFEKTYWVKGIHIVMNCPAKASIKQKIDYTSALSLPENAFIVLYQGVLNEGRGLHLLTRAFQYTSDEIFLIILGDGVLKKTLQNEIERLGVSQKIILLGEISHENLMFYTAGAHLGINLLEQINLSKSLASPNKLFQYIHSELPVLASYSYENDKVFNKYKIGKQVKNNEIEIAKTICSFANEDLSAYKIACKAAKEEYNWENQEKTFKHIIT